MALYQRFSALKCYIGGGWLRLTAVFFCVKVALVIPTDSEILRKHRAEGAGARRYSENKSLSDNLHMRYRYHNLTVLTTFCRCGSIAL